MIAPLPVRRTALAGLVALLALTPTASAQTPTGGVAPTTTAPATSAPTSADPSATPTEGSPTPTRASAQLPGAGTWSAVPTRDSARPVRITGAFEKTLARRGVTVERRTVSGRWQRAASAKVRSNGRFSTTWKTRSTGVSELRVVLASASSRSSTAASGRAAANAPSVRIAVLGRVKATWYGPGLYGKTTACGVTLQPDTVGVAHRTLPCGTQVEFRRGGKTVVAPVIDRGPFANDATFDLTKPVADQIGVDGVDPVSFVTRDDLPLVATPSKAPASSR